MCYSFKESFTKRFMYLCTNKKRCDDAADKYLQNSIKENIRNIRGKVSRRTFDDDDTTILPDFKSDFLTHRQNKNDLHIYLADKIVKFRKITI